MGWARYTGLTARSLREYCVRHGAAQGAGCRSGPLPEITFTPLPRRSSVAGEGDIAVWLTSTTSRKSMRFDSRQSSDLLRSGQPTQMIKGRMP